MRTLEQGLPRFDMRSPALRAKHKKLAAKEEALPLSPMQQAIIARVALETGIVCAAITSPQRSRAVIAARHEAIRRVKAACPAMSLSMLGRIFRCDFSTISHVLRRAAVAQTGGAGA